MSKPKSVFLSAITGNILEYYDFTVYSVFSAAIGRTFFPLESKYVQSEFIQIVLSLSVFAVGFLTRPIGGIFFGYIGDKYGRRTSLITSMLGMTIPTFVMGLIPSYYDIGGFAPALLLTMRLLQGLCISGEGAGAAIFILEHHQNLRPGFTAGLVHGSNIAGTLIATLIGIIIQQYFFHVDFAWRFAFLLGGIMGLVGFYLRLRVSETPIFQMLAQQKKTLKAPFSNVVRTAWKAMILTFCTGAVASSVLYLVKTVNIYYHNVMRLDNTTALIYLFYASVISMIAMPLFGGLADFIGKFKMITCATIAVLLLALPTMFVMALVKTTWQQILALTVLGALGGAISGAAYIFIISLFTPEQKFSGVSFSYNLGIATFGGTSPIISRWLVEKTGLFYAPAFYIMSTSILFLLIIYCMRGEIRRIIKTVSL